MSMRKWSFVLSAATIGLIYSASQAAAQNLINFTGSGLIAQSGSSLAMADVNADGKTDILVYNVISHEIAVYLNTAERGATAIGFSGPHVIGVETSPTFITTVDVNGDGKPDIVVANIEESNVSVLINSTVPSSDTPSFAPRQLFAMSTQGEGTLCVTPADVNGDGKPDLVVNNGNGIALLINRTAAGATTASFDEPQYLGAASYTCVAVADLNGDGKADLVFVPTNNAIGVLLNSTATNALTASFFEEKDFAVAQDIPSSIAIADLNGDGNPDIVVAGGTDAVSLLANVTGHGSAEAAFAASQSVNVGLSVWVSTADFDGDGKPDLVTTEGNDVSLLLNTTMSVGASSSFAAPQAYPLPSFAHGAVFVTAGDVNGDGGPDVVLADSGVLSVSILLQTMVNLNQQGLTGSWFNPATGGQGIELVVYPDLVGAGQGLLFGGWFTYDVDAAGGRRWYGLTGNVRSDNSLADLQIFDVEGGNFAAPPAVGPTGALGTATIRFDSCTSGVLIYAFSDGSHRSGKIPLTRLTPNANCSLSGYDYFTPTASLLSGNWFNPETSGQGFMLDFSPAIGTMFGAWYTFAKNGSQIGGAVSQNWYTLQTSHLLPDRRLLSNVPIIETSGGAFDKGSPAPASVVVGTADITLLDCSTMTLRYSFAAGENAGLSDTIALLRLGPEPPHCVLP